MPTYTIDLRDSEAQALARLAEVAGETVEGYLALLVRDELLLTEDGEEPLQRKDDAGHTHGQGMVEYGLIIAAVALAAIIALFALGPKVASMFSGVATSLQ